MPAWLAHGGAVDVAAAHYGISPAQWLDLSTGVSPYPYPVAEIDATAWRRLPTAASAAALETAAAAYYGCPPQTAVVAVPGSQSAIQWLPRLITPGHVAVLAPTYTPHGDAWLAAGHIVARISSLDALPAPCDAVVIVNPNNPDGRIVPVETLLALSEHLLVVVDEAFADVAPAASLAGHPPSAARVVLRSFGKFFGLAGARLGFVLAEPSLAARLRAALGPWAVSGPAQVVGTRALADRPWIETSRAALSSGCARLRALLAGHGLDILGGTDLFVLATTRAASVLFDHLARHAILVRAFADQPTWLRFGLPGGGTDFARLETALDTWGERAGEVRRIRGRGQD